MLVESAAVVPVLFGVKCQWFEFSGSSPLRPYAYGSAGPDLGYAAGVEVGPTTISGTRREAAMGVRLAAGRELLIRRLFIIGSEAEYLGIADFGSPIGVSRTAADPSFALLLV